MTEILRNIGLCEYFLRYDMKSTHTKNKLNLIEMENFCASKHTVSFYHHFAARRAIVNNSQYPENERAEREQESMFLRSVGPQTKEPPKLAILL